jgi:hypothetical protein
VLPPGDYPLSIHELEGSFFVHGTGVQSPAWDASSRRPDHNATKRQLPMWHRYRVELYPHFGNLSGIRDAFGNDLTFPAAFRASRRANRPKGIVQIVR